MKHKTLFDSSCFKIVRIGATVPRVRIETPQEVVNYYKSYIATLDFFEADRESVYVLAMDTKMNCLGSYCVSIGSLDSSTVHPREVWRFAILQNAWGVVLIHNHPTGDSAPSDADLAVTRKLKAAGDNLEIRLMDHIIVGTQYFSFREAGVL